MPEPEVSATVYAPGLFTSFAEIGRQELDQLSCPSISRILSRAKKQVIDSADPERWLYQQFVGDTDTSINIPVAAITALQDGLESREGYWMRADPVYLYPDTHSLILQDPLHLKLSDDEVQSIANLIAPLFDDYDVQLVTPHHGRWYLRFSGQPPEITCTSLYEALSKPVNEYLPQGEDRRRWHTLFNEIQMLLNQSEVNRQREEKRLPPVNSLWFWGEGTLPDELHSRYEQCLGNDYLLAGLCAATNTPYELLSRDALQNIPADKEVLVVDERLQRAIRINSPEQWLNALVMLEEETIAPLMEGQQQDRYQGFTLLDSDKVFQCDKNRLKAFWRPIRKLSAYLG